MLERETEQIIGVMSQRTIGGGPSISLREILAADIPQGVKSFFRYDVESMLHDEQQAAMKNSRFNHDHPDIRSARAQLHSSLVLHFTFSRKEFLARLGDCVHLLANFLVRPQWTLTGVVFEKETTITTAALKRLLDYFSPYDYLKNVFFRYAGDKRIESFTREEFSALLFRIESAFVRRKTGPELCDALRPMYEFFDFPRNSGKNAMPLKALIKFFEDKGLTDIHTRLEGELAQGAAELGLTALGEIIEDVRRTSGGFRVERTEKKGSEPAAPAPGTGHPAESAPGTRSPGIAQSSVPEGKASARPGIDIAGAIGEGEKRKFVRKIFRQDDEKFEEAIRHLGELPNWKEASRHIDEIFILNDVDPYSAEAERFIEIVFTQYHPSR